MDNLYTPKSSKIKSGNQNQFTILYQEFERKSFTPTNNFGLPTIRKNNELFLNFRHKFIDFDCSKICIQKKHQFLLIHGPHSGGYNVKLLKSKENKQEERQQHKKELEIAIRQMNLDPAFINQLVQNQKETNKRFLQYFSDQHELSVDESGIEESEKIKQFCQPYNDDFKFNYDVINQMRMRTQKSTTQNSPFHKLQSQMKSEPEEVKAANFALQGKQMKIQSNECKNQIYYREVYQNQYQLKKIIREKKLEMIKKIHEGKLQVSFERRKKKERFYEKPKTSSKPKTDLKMKQFLLEPEFQTKEQVFETKLKNYLCFVKNLQKESHLPIATSEQNHYLFSIGRGNNSKLIKHLLKKRWWWTETTEKIYNFKWTQLKSQNIHNNQPQFSRIIANQNPIVMQNHLEFNYELGDKKQLLANMKTYYQMRGEKIWEKLPETFHIKDGLNDEEYILFKGQFEANSVWIVKPGENSNRGQGIAICSDMAEIERIVLKQSGKHTLIVQRYIEKPYLYYNRKFDLRCYLLIVCHNGLLRGYWYENAYIRTSSAEYSTKVLDPLIHLTNDAIQKFGDEYGKFESGNKISLEELQKYFSARNEGSSVVKIMEQLKGMATDCVRAVANRIDALRRLHNFEIFGLDFMVDSNLKPWLIEVNTNPCLELSCSILGKIIPKMVEHALQIGLDPVFPPPKVWPTCKRILICDNPQETNHFVLIYDEK